MKQYDDLKRYLRRKWWILREEWRANKELADEVARLRACENALRGELARREQSIDMLEQRCRRQELMLRHDGRKHLLEEAKGFIQRGHDGLVINRYELRTWLYEYEIEERGRNARAPE